VGVEAERKSGRPRVAVCQSSRPQYTTGFVRPVASQNTRMQENAKLEGQHFKLQPSLEIERQESLVVVGGATHE